MHGRVHRGFRAVLSGTLMLGGGLTASLVVAPALSASATSYGVTATIGVGKDPDAVAVDPTTGTVYVANAEDAFPSDVSVINETTDTVTDTIGVGNLPAGAAVDPTTGTVYVANQFSNTVSVIDEATDAVTGTITVGNDPLGVAVDPTTDTVYVTNDGDSTVSVIDGATNGVIGTIGVGLGASRGRGRPNDRHRLCDQRQSCQCIGDRWGHQFGHRYHCSG